MKNLLARLLFMFSSFLVFQFSESVEKFKLLGVIKEHVADVCMKINRRFFNIKRIVYLCTAVKLQFLNFFTIFEL
jgi:hypothetical protein